LLVDPDFWRATGVTVTYLGLTAVAKLILGVAMALLLARPSRWRAAAFIAVFLPWAYPGGVTAIAWYRGVNPPLARASRGPAGRHRNRGGDGALGAGASAFASVAFFNVWRGASFTAVFLLAGLTAIPTELLDYARLETRSAWQRFSRIVVPLLRPYLALAVFL